MRHIVKTFIARQTTNLALNSIMHFSSSKKDKTTEELESLMKEEQNRMIKQELYRPGEDRRKRQEQNRMIKQELQRLKKQGEDRIKRQEEDRRKRQEEDRRKRQEEDKRKKQEEDRIKRQEEDRRKRQEQNRMIKQELQRLKKQGEDRIKRQEEDRRKRQEEDKRKKQEEDKRKKQEEDRIKRQEEDRRKRQEQNRMIKQELQRLKKQGEDRIKRQEEDRRKRQEEDRRKRQEEDRRKRQEEDRRRRQEEDRRRRQEEDRRRRQEEDRRRRQEEDRRRIEEKINKQKSNYGQKLKTILQTLGAVGTIGALYFAYVQYKAPKEPVQIQKQKEAFQKNGEKQVFQIDKDYIQGSFVEKQMKKLFDEPEKKLVKFVVGKISSYLGCPGIGKTTAIQKIIRDQRNKGVKCFYINLRDGVDPNSTQSGTKKIDQMISLIQSIPKNLPKDILQEKKKVKLVIDDINRLQRLNDTQLFDKMSVIYSLFSHVYLDVTCISSSSGFISRLKKQSAFGKSAWLHIVQDPQKEKQQFLKQILQKKGSSLNLNQSVKDYLLEHFTLPRSLIIQINKLQNEQHKEKTNQQRLQFLKSSFQKQKQLQNKIITNAFQQLTNKKMAALLGFKLLKQQQILNEVGCQKIQNSTNDSFPGHMKYIQKAVNILDDNNMLIFCRPRQRIHRQAIREFLMKKYPEELKDMSEPQRNE